MLSCWHICTCRTYLCKYIECAYLPAVHMVEEAQTQVVKTLIERRVHHGLLIVTPAGSLHVQEVTCQNMQCNMSVSTYRMWPVKTVHLCQFPHIRSDLSKLCNMSASTCKKGPVKTVKNVSLQVQEVTCQITEKRQSSQTGSDLSKQCNMSVFTYRKWLVISVQYVSLHIEEVTCQNSAICQSPHTGIDPSYQCNMSA